MVIIQEILSKKCHVLCPHIPMRQDKSNHAKLKSEILFNILQSHVQTIWKKTYQPYE